MNDADSPSGITRRRPRYIPGFASPRSKSIQTSPASFGGTVTDRYETIETDGGYLPITDTLFDHDAKVLENGQVQKVSLVDGEKKAYLTVEFDSPLVGIWSPPKKHAPFICIEPWYGRCDSESFAGELKDRDWEQSLEPGESFEAEYRIIAR